MNADELEKLIANSLEDTHFADLALEFIKEHQGKSMNVRHLAWLESSDEPHSQTPKGGRSGAVWRISKRYGMSQLERSPAGSGDTGQSFLVAHETKNVS